MKARILLITFLCLLGFNGILSADEEQLVRRVHAHLIIKDYVSAYEEAKQALEFYSCSKALQEGLIKSLAKLGNEKEMLRAWDNYSAQFPDKKIHRALIEEMCWGILNKASTSSSLVTRLMSMLAAYFSQDAKGIEILYQSLRDPNSSIRATGVKLASRFRDTKLIDEIKRLLKEEKVWSVRKEIIQAIGQMKIIELRPNLEALIASNQNLAEEKALAITALVDLLDEVKREEIERLACSNRAGLRLLACEAIAHFHSLRDYDQLLQLVEDDHPDVRTAALQALGLLRPANSQETILTLALNGIRDSNFKVGISAAWLLTLYAPFEGQQAFESYLASSNREIRIAAASALAATGRYGADLALYVFETHQDPYVRLNLALGLIGQRLANNRTAKVLNDTLESEKEKWMWVEEGIFRSVAPRTIKKIESDSTAAAINTPEMENQLVRLEILNLLAILHVPTAQESVRRFLAERSWGISGVAAALLLMEGDHSAIELVQSLLKDFNPKIRLQAALVLSLWGREESAIYVLEQEYQHADKELKERILEGLGRIGSMTSVPFLVGGLKEPSQTLRIIAAMALIQCLNH